MKIPKRVRKILAGVLLGLLLFTGFGCQHRKINYLEDQINGKQEQQVTTKTHMYKDAIVNKFNDMQSYKIEDGKINFKHDFSYSKKATFTTHEVSISAFADVYYEYDVDLSNANITETEDTITILLPEPYLNEESLHVDLDSIQYINSKTHSSLFANKEDSRNASKEFISSLEKEAYKKIDKYYAEENKGHIPYNAKKQVKKLVGSFIHDKEIVVDMK